MQGHTQLQRKSEMKMGYMRPTKNFSKCVCVCMHIYVCVRERKKNERVCAYEFLKAF